MDFDDGIALQNAAKFLRGEIRPVAQDALSDRRALESNFELYRRTRRMALALWHETVGVQNHVMCSLKDWPDDSKESTPCLLWRSGSWHCATARWFDYPEKKNLKVNFVGYDREDAVIVRAQDPRIRRAVLDPRGGRNSFNHQVLQGIFPKPGDYVRIHVLDAEEASLFLQEDRYLVGVVVAPIAVHDSSTVSVIGLTGAELLLVPNTRMEFVTAENGARVEEIFKVSRNKVLRQLDIATSQKLAIKVVSGVGMVVDEITPVSLWALGDQLLIRVWQQTGEFMVETFVSAPEALAAVGMKGSGLTVLLDSERKHLLERVINKLRLSDGQVTMEIITDLLDGQDPGPANSIVNAPLYRESRSLEGVIVETVVLREGVGGLLIRTRTFLPGPERVHNIFVQPEDWKPLRFPSLLWLGDNKRATLVQQLTRSICAMDGSVALDICGRLLRPEGFIPMPDESPSNSISVRLPAPRNKKSAHSQKGVESPCSSGAPSGLCCCQNILKVGISLPLSAPETKSAKLIDGNEGAGPIPTSSGRWLVMVKAVGGELRLSLLRPSRGCQFKARTQECEQGTRPSENRSGKYEAGISKRLRPSVDLVVTWIDWAHLGYGPLQWMSHLQKVFFGSLALSWVSLRTIGGYISVGNTNSEAYLDLHPTLVRVTRNMDIPRDNPFSPDRGNKRSTANRFCGEKSRTQVVVRDEGQTFRVEVEAGVDGHSDNWKLNNAFAKEAWEETGLGDLLWVNCSWRRYLARRLSQQVGISVTKVKDGEEQGQDVSKETAALVVRSDQPVLYWSGTIPIARLGSQAKGVFVTILDAGRRMLIKARDFEGGPVLACSTVSLEVWTAVTGIPALRPPTAHKALRKRLENQLAGLLGAGFRSRTSRLAKKRMLRQKRSQGRGYWRGTLAHISDVEMDLQQIDDDDSGSEKDDVCTKTPPRSSLPPLSSADEAQSQKRALRLEMLMRMIDEFHVKHGRYGNNETSFSPTALLASSGEKNVAEPNNLQMSEDKNISIDPVDLEVDGIGKTNTAVNLPAIDSPAPVSEPNDSLGRQLQPPSDQSRHDQDGSKNSNATTTLVAHVCVCCRGEGGKGHGSRCEHTFRRCGVCRVREVQLILSGVEDERVRFSDAGRKEISTGHQLRASDGKQLRRGVEVLGGEEEEEEEEYDWITDTNEEDPEFKCDTCGRAVEDNVDRFHCQTCGDYDLCQECFLSQNAARGNQTELDDGTGAGHLASHDITQIMAKVAAPDWSS